MKITNLTKQVRTVSFGVQELIIRPLETVEIPKQQEATAKKAMKSNLWKRLLDCKVFSLDEQANLTESEATILPEVEAPAELKQANKRGKGRAKITTEPTLDSTTTV